MLKLNKIIKVSHVVASPIVFILFYEWGWQGGVFIVIKNVPFYYFNRLGSFPKFLGRLKSSFYQNCMK